MQLPNYNELLEILAHGKPIGEFSSKDMDLIRQFVINETDLYPSVEKYPWENFAKCIGFFDIPQMRLNPIEHLKNQQVKVASSKPLTLKEMPPDIEERLSAILFPSAEIDQKGGIYGMVSQSLEVETLFMKS